MRPRWARPSVCTPWALCALVSTEDPIPADYSNTFLYAFGVSVGAPWCFAGLSAVGGGVRKPVFMLLSVAAHLEGWGRVRWPPPAGSNPVAPQLVRSQAADRAAAVEPLSEVAVTG